MNRAIIVIGHGSRSADATAQFLQVVDFLRARQGDTLVLPAFMELAEPTLSSAIAQAVAAGVTEIIVVPCFLYRGIHIKEDIPEMLDALAQTHPQVHVHFANPIGADPRIADILSERVEEAVCLV